MHNAVTLSKSETEFTSGKGSRAGHFRWTICAMLFAATTINYMDRSIIGVLGPTLRDKVFHWSNEQYSWLTMAFQAAYTIGLMMMGILMDRIGLRLGYVIAIGIWSLFGLLHAAILPAFSMVGFVIARFGLGIGEGGNFPACIKTVAEWFPKKERALATGVFNAGSNVGAIMAPLIIPLIVHRDGTNWQFAFLITASFSALWVFGWLRIYRRPAEHPRLTQTELDYIRSDGEEGNLQLLPWQKLLPLRETWAFAVAKTTDAVWWFYLFWGSFFLADKFHLDIRQLGIPLIVIYVGADFGSIAGGWLSGKFLKSGWTVNKSRKITLLICALLIFPVTFAPACQYEWVAVALVALAAGAHQAWSANIFTIVSDVFPKKATASVVGIGGMAGSLVSLLANLTLGKTVKAGDASGFAVPFACAGVSYLLILFVVHLLMPRMARLNEDLGRASDP
jgi:ACS family hexuronate transporter-like MFS transporter